VTRLNPSAFLANDDEDDDEDDDEEDEDEEDEEEDEEVAIGVVVRWC
jgi:hypothetical protein